MALFDLHFELAQTNALLTRIADALERAFPVPVIPDHTKHPMIGAGDVSRLTPAHIAELARRREEALAASYAIATGFQATAAGETSESRDANANAQERAMAAQTSVTGVWDYEDDLGDVGEHTNHPIG